MSRVLTFACDCAILARCKEITQTSVLKLTFHFEKGNTETFFYEGVEFKGVDIYNALNSKLKQ